MSPGCHHNSLFSTRKPTAKHMQEDCASSESAGAQCVPALVSAKSGKLLVPSHSYLSRKVQCQCIEHVFTDKLPASYHLQNSIARKRERGISTRTAAEVQDTGKKSLILRKALHCGQRGATAAITQHKAE